MSEWGTKGLEFGGRRQGRTYRNVLLSLLQASEGKRVVFITPHDWKHPFSMAYQAAAGFASEINHQLGVIRFPNGGELKFFRDDKRLNDRLAGLNPTIVRDS